MPFLESVSLEVDNIDEATEFYTKAFGVTGQLGLRESTAAPTSGFRGFHLSLLVAQPANVRALLDAALDAGAKSLKPAAKSFWGFGGVIQSPDGSIWKVATSHKKDTAPASRTFESIVLLLGARDVAATKNFLVDHGLAVAKSYGRKYVEFTTPESPVKLALYGFNALAKDAGVTPDGSGSHRLILGGDSGAFTDPDGFLWEATTTEKVTDR